MTSTAIGCPNPEFVDKLGRRQIDAAFSTFAPPNAAVTTVAKGGARLIDIAGPAIEELRTRYPYLKRMVIPPPDLSQSA